MELIGNFLHSEKWAPKYQRNNKRSGLKNLRCFPFCLDEHRVKGFCGRPVTFQVDNTTHKPLFAWAEFRKVDDLGEIGVGTNLSREEITLKERSRKENNRPWYIGQLASGNENTRADDRVTFEFNNQKKGWNYGWAANKHTCNAVHTFQVYLFQEIKQDIFQCIGTYTSPTFTLFCRRRPALSVSQQSQISTTESEVSASPRFIEMTKNNLPSPSSVESSPKRSYPFTNEPNEVVQFHFSNGTTATSAGMENGMKHTAQRKRSRISSQDIKHEPNEIAMRIEAEENEKALNARLWRLTVILDLLEARWTEECLVKKPALPSFDDLSFQRPMENKNQPSMKKENGLDDIKPKSELQIELQQNEPNMEDEFDAEFEAVRLDGNYDFDDLLDDQTENLQNASFDTFIPAFEKKPEVQQKNVLDEFGKYLLFETEISAQIQNVFSTYCPNPAETLQKHKSGFMHIMNTYLSKFLMTHQMSLKEFEDLIGESMKEKQIDPVSRRPHAVARFRMLLQQIRYSPTDDDIAMHMIPKDVPPHVIPPELNLSGVWGYDDAILNALDCIRELRGVPWIIRKMLSGMEQTFKVTQVPGKIYFQHKRKMLANGFVEYVLDGKQNAWNSSSPIPWTKPLVFTTRASFEGDHYRFEHYYSTTLRSKRLYRKAYGGDKLEIIVAIQAKNAKNLMWEDQYSACGFAYPL